MPRADLLAAVLNKPRDNAARLAYADAIPASDPARAEFIRAQVSLAGCRGRFSPEQRILHRRAQALTKEHGKRWRAQLPSLPGVTWGGFARGFINLCTVSDAATFRRQAAAIFAAAPIEGLCINRLAPASLPELLDAHELARLRGLFLYPGSLGDPEVSLLADCPRLANLRALNLCDNRIGDPGVRDLAVSPHLGRLRALDLTQNKISTEGLRALAHSTTLLALSSLRLYGNTIDDVGLIDLAASPLAGRLRHLNVGGSSATVAGARALAQSPALAGLRSLDINNSQIGDAGLMYLTQSPHLRRLRKLYLRRTEIGDAGIAVLLRSPLAPRLRVLDIEAADITGIVAWQIVRSTELGRLRKLEMWDCDNVSAPAANALKLHFGKRVTVHADEHPRRIKPHPDDATRANFLTDIRARPDDDAPRLIYADWLDEHDDSDRAEFIRVQCELARLDHGNPRRAALKRREKKLLNVNQERWTEKTFLGSLRHSKAECPDPYSHKVCEVMARTVETRLCLQQAQDPGERRRLQTQLGRCRTALKKQRLLAHEANLPLFEKCEFERGFPDSVVVPELMLLDFAGAIRDLGVVQYLTALMDPEDAEAPLLVDRVIACFDSPRLRTLNIQGHVEQLSKFEALAAWPGAAELTDLEFGFVWGLPGDDVLRVLAGSPYLRNLHRLRLYLCEGFTEAGVTALADSPNLPALRTVLLGEDENEVSEEAERTLRQRFPSSRS